MYKVESRWALATSMLGKILQPACQINGIISLQHLTGLEAKEGEPVTCLVECDEATINTIIAHGLGTIVP